MSIEQETPPTVKIGFEAFGLKPELLEAVKSVGYETPSPIQAQTIPHLLEGRDVVGQAQTGTGKTAAFALPLLNRIDLSQRTPQILVLAPTRELAIQVAEAFQTYAGHLKGFHILPIYGGQEYHGQLKALSRGVHVVVGTPGRVMDHLRRKTLKLGGLQALVLDEADEMLRMGFIDDVEWILEQTPSERQIALFSATMPNQIRRIAKKYLNDPVEVTIKMPTTTASTIRQRLWMVSGYHKLDALTRILEAEETDGVLIFVRTKTSTVELADRLGARGYAVDALNGDIAQNKREKTIEHLKNGRIDLLVATDVAARGLDVHRISHVINYDIPYDTEAYVHRIGRTGRAGRQGEAILFASPRERRLLRDIERATHQKIEQMKLPSTEIINDKRIARFKQQITDTLGVGDLTFYQDLIEQYRVEHDIPALEIAAALAKLTQGDRPLLLEKNERVVREFKRDADSGDRGRSRRPRSGDAEEQDLRRYRLEVGHMDGVKPGNIVGAITNEAGLTRKQIGHIKINEDYSLIDLPKSLPRETFLTLKKVWVSGKQLEISEAGQNQSRDSSAPKRRFISKTGRPPEKKASPRSRGGEKGQIRRGYTNWLDM